MLKVSKPRKPRKAEQAMEAELRRLEEDVLWSEELETLLDRMKALGYDPRTGLWWHESLADFQTLWSYCRTDVDSEHGLSAALPDLPEQEFRIWQMDQRANLKGVLGDVKLAKAALRLVDKAISQMNAELEAITGIEGIKGSSRGKVKEWLADQGLHLSDTQGATLDAWLEKGFHPEGVLRPDVHRVLRIVREVNRTSTAKYKSCLAMAGLDGRLRDLMMYHGASTGRWAGRGLQPHNFPRGSLKDMMLACEVILTEDMALIRAMYGEVIALLSDALRGLIKSSPGKDLIVADYSAIEARVVMWLAHEKEALDVFRTGKCIYMDMATGIYGYPVVDKKKQADERQMGKQAILGLGFGMGFITFLLTCKKYKISFTREQARRIVGGRWAELTDYMEMYFFPERKPDLDPKKIDSQRKEGAKRRRRITNAGMELREVIHELILMKHIVDVYRERYAGVAQMWEDVEAAAVAAIRAPGREVYSELGRVTFVVDGRFLKCYLPSGRPLHYCDPRVIDRKTPWGKVKPVILFMGTDPYTKQWCVQDTYGGKLVENITQATARDLMAEAMLAAEESGVYEVLLSVHDELIAEVEEGVGSVEEFEELMSRTPAWAGDCPVTAEGWRGKRYRK